MACESAAALAARAGRRSRLAHRLRRRSASSAITTPSRGHARREPHAAGERVDEGVVRRVGAPRAAGSPPSDAVPEAVHELLLLGRADRRCRASESASSLRARCWKRAPSAATPNVPPTIRLIDRIPEATPAFCGVDRVHRGGGHRRHRERHADAHQHEGGEQQAVAGVDGRCASAGTARSRRASARSRSAAAARSGP